MLLVMTYLQRARASVFVYFLLCGAAVTMWATHIPLVEKNLSINHAQIGILILILGAGALAAMQPVGAWVDKHGSAKILKISSVFLGLALVLPGFAGNFALLAIAVFVLGAGIGGIDIAMNAHAIETEKAYGRPIFSAFHAMWSIGGVIGSAVAGVAIAVSMSMAATMTSWGAVTVIVGLICSKYLLPKTTSQVDQTKAVSKNKIGELYFVLFLGCIAAAAAIVEGVGIDWSALFTIERFDQSPATASISIGIFAAAMATIRFVADKVVAKFGRIFVIRNGAILATLGLTVALTAPMVQLSWLGWALAGVGISAVVPQCMAVSSEIGSAENQGRNLAKVVGLTYAGVLGGPATIGFLGAALGLQLSLTLGILLALFIAVGSVFISRGKEKYGQVI